MFVGGGLDGPPFALLVFANTASSGPGERVTTQRGCHRSEEDLKEDRCHHRGALRFLGVLVLDCFTRPNWKRVLRHHDAAWVIVIAQRSHG